MQLSDLLKSEVWESVLSYSVAGTAYASAKLYEKHLAEYAADAHDISIIVVCGVVILRFIYDAVRLWRYLRRNK